jgi:catechol 2,3-dioxygenase-like lactoylglutathione lyase family enzyme
MPVRRVSVVSVPVSDQEVAKEFYLEALGFELVRDDASVPGLRWVEVRPAGGETSLTLVDWFRDTMPAGSLQGLVLALDDLRASYEQLVGKRVVFDQPLEERPWGLEAVVRDPDGNRLVLQQA